MPTYSAGGYIAAVVIRTGRTLLVEGRSDKAALARLVVAMRRIGRLVHDNVVIDTAEEVRSPAGAVQGNRDKVEFAHAGIGNTAGKFAAVVDREFRHFDLADARDDLGKHLVIDGSLFWTRGHSVENYFHVVDSVIRYLEECVPEHLPGNYEPVLRGNYDALLRGSAAISLAALQAHISHRVHALRSVDHWQLDAAGDIAINNVQVISALPARGVSSEDSALFRDFLEFYSQLLAVRPAALSQWIARGHTASEYIWTGVGKLLTHHGMPKSVADRVAYGDIDLKNRIAAGLWTDRILAGHADSPVELVQWMGS
jgi:hypothetical protein